MLSEKRNEQNMYQLLFCMFFNIFFLCYYLKPGQIQELNIFNWNQFVENRKEEKPWIIFFDSSTLLVHNIYMPIIENASTIADGLFNFGYIDDYKNPGIGPKYNITLLPAFLMLNKNGHKEYKGKRTEDEILKHAQKYVIDSTRKADKSWLSDNYESAILFTDKPKTPSIWAGISTEFKSAMKIGISNSTKLLKQFAGDDAKFPTIIMKNSSCVEKYVGKVSFGSIKSTLEEFLAGEYEVPYQFHNDYFLPEEYKEEIKGFTGYCVISATSDLPDELKKAKETIQSKRFKYFYGTKNLPFKFIEQDSVWIIHPVQNRAVRVQSFDKISETVENVLNGNVSWIPIDPSDEL